MRADPQRGRQAARYERPHGRQTDAQALGNFASPQICSCFRCRFRHRFPPSRLRDSLVIAFSPNESSVFLARSEFLFRGVRITDNTDNLLALTSRCRPCRTTAREPLPEVLPHEWADSQRPRDHTSMISRLSRWGSPDYVGARRFRAVNQGVSSTEDLGTMSRRPRKRPRRDPEDDLRKRFTFLRKHFPFLRDDPRQLARRTAGCFLRGDLGGVWGAARKRATARPGRHADRLRASRTGRSPVGTEDESARDATAQTARRAAGGGVGGKAGSVTAGPLAPGRRAAGRSAWPWASTPPRPTPRVRKRETPAGRSRRRGRDRFRMRPLLGNNRITHSLALAYPIRRNRVKRFGHGFWNAPRPRCRQRPQRIVYGGGGGA